MADFCRQCSIETFGEDYGDMEGITTPEQEEAGLAAVVLCEGCGVIQVNVNGECISPNCQLHGQLAMPSWRRRSIALFGLFPLLIIAVILWACSH